MKRIPQWEPTHRVDPVCGKRLAPEGGPSRTREYKRRRYYFCSDSCLATFHQHTARLRLSEMAKAGALMNPEGVRWGLA